MYPVLQLNYYVLTRRKSGPIETALSDDVASCARQQKTMSIEWCTPENEETLVDLWRDEPVTVLYSTTSKGYSNRNLKYAALHRIAQQFDTSGNYNVFLRYHRVDPIPFPLHYGIYAWLPGLKSSWNASQPVRRPIL